MIIMGNLRLNLFRVRNLYILLSKKFYFIVHKQPESYICLVIYCDYWM